MFKYKKAATVSSMSTNLQFAYCGDNSWRYAILPEAFEMISDYLDDNDVAEIFDIIEDAISSTVL